MFICLISFSNNRSTVNRKLSALLWVCHHPTQEVSLVHCGWSGYVVWFYAAFKCFFPKYDISLIHRLSDLWNSIIHLENGNVTIVSVIGSYCLKYSTICIIFQKNTLKCTVQRFSYSEDNIL